MGTYWADVSQYQRVVDDSYPHRVFSFRSNSGNKLDANAAANLAWSLKALDDGRLDIVIVYYFFRPGQANCDLWKDVVTVNGRIHPRIVCMVDVEGDKGSVRGNNSAEINDEVQRVQGWLGGNRVIGYLNPNADPGLWPTRPNIPLVVPHYNNTPGQSYAFPNRFAHQYSDRVSCAPFGPCDANYTALDIPALAALVGVKIPGGTVATPEDVQQQLRGPELKGWPQLGDQTVVDALADVRDSLVQPVPSLINPEVAFDLPTYARLIDAAAYRTERAQERIEAALERIEKKLGSK